VEIPKNLRSWTQSRVHPQKMRFQGDGSEQDDGASGFAWVAREP
jgi:hypothetical protein